MEVMVTGGTGFIGSHLISKLTKNREFEVYNLSRYVTGRYVAGENVKTFFADLRDYYAIQKAIRQLQPEIVIHLAALTPVSYSFDHPQEIIEVNFYGTVNLAEACLHYIPHFKQFIFASSSEVYGNQDKFPISENFTPKPNTPYAISKFASEKYLIYLHNAYNFPITIMRPFNTYGRKKNRHFIVERIITQILEGKNVINLGNPDAIRDLMFVEDHVNAYLKVLDNPKARGETFNFCTGRKVSIKQLVEIINDLVNWGGRVAWNTIPHRPSDISCLIGSWKKAKKILNWEPKWKLEDGLLQTIEYWRGKLHNK